MEPTRYRPEGYTSSIKTRTYRVRGLEVKFTKKSDLLTFKRRVFEHLVEYGMDTITYLPSPDNSQKMVSVIHHHARFSVAEAKQAEAEQAKLYDFNDQGNIRDAKKFLLDSLDDSLEKQVYESTNRLDSFIQFWMNLMSIVESISINRFDGIKAKLKSRNIGQYPGQNIVMLCSDYLSDYTDLDNASMYDFTLTMHMLQKIMEAGNEDFKSELRPVRKSLNTQLLKVRHLSYEDQKKMLVDAELDVKNVLKKCKEEYRILLDENKWPAASHAKDSKALNRNYGSANATTKAKSANALEKNATGGGKDKSKDSCHNCGLLGHHAYECKNPPKDKGGNTQGRKSQGKPARKPRFPEPKDGESEVKIEQGKKWMWCAKCRNWTPHHGTAGHVPRAQLKQQQKANMARMDLKFHPSAYTVRYNR